MSQQPVTIQTSWEETVEEFQRRREQAGNDRQGWLGTLTGVAIALAALAVVLST